MKRVSAIYFTDKELLCKCGDCPEVLNDPIFDGHLTLLRKELNKAMIINSCNRCKAHNQRVGGAPKSFHISDEPAWEGVDGCAAVDVRYTNKDYRDELAKLAWKRGFRIGFNKSFLHLDSAHHLKVLNQSVFKYDNVTDKELADFKAILK
jgi:hypothetical protein